MEENIKKEADKPTMKKRGRPRKETTPGDAVVIAQEPKAVVVEGVGEKTGAVLPKSKILGKDRYVFAVGRRKRAVARIFFYKGGNGEIEINGKPIAQYFGRKNLQEVIVQSLQHSPFKKSARIVIKARGGGLTGQAEAACLGITHALLKIDETLRPIFQARGFLTRDSRRKERKKPGLKRARRAPQFSKR